MAHRRSRSRDAREIDASIGAVGMTLSLTPPRTILVTAFVSLLGACGGGGGSVVTPASARARATGFTVRGNQLFAGGKPLRLFGVNRSGTEYACVNSNAIFEGPTDVEATAAIKSWHANVVRVPLNEGCWLAINGADPRYSGATYKGKVVDYVARLNAAGLFAILDLHWAGAGTTLPKSQAPMPDRDHSPAFWSDVATTFKDNPDVMFDVYNEPYGVDWACWRDGCTVTPQERGASGAYQAAGMQELVTAIRATGATQPIMLGGLAYANDLSGWLAHEPVDPMNALVASFHQYNFNACASRACWDATVAPIARVVPLVTGELGEDDCAHGFIDDYMAWADARGVSYLGWTWNTWDCKTGPALITTYDGTPSPFGEGLKAHFALVNP
jgi:hypothetical protein